jgi:uncharacterized protein YcfJ
MGFSQEKIKSNYRSMESGAFASAIKSKANGYKNGAIAGGVTGLVCALIFKGKVVIWTVVGAVAGGYIGYKISESSEEQSAFVKGK